MRTRTALGISLLVPLLVVPTTFSSTLSACGGDDEIASSEDAGQDRSSPDGTATGDGASGDANGDGSTAGTFHDVTDGSLWSAFNLSIFDPDFASGTGFFSGAFDGRYVYFAPYQRGVAGEAGASVLSGRVVRYDSQQEFTNPGAWSKFDAEQFGANARAFMSSAFDGRYVYFIPGPASNGVVKYDTQKPFDQAGSWSLGAAPDDYGYPGVALDGQNLYIGAISTAGPMRRHDNQAALDAGWSQFDPTTLVPAGGRTTGAVFDGRYVYFGPGTNVAVPNGVTVRYDTTTPFSDAGSWSSFDIASITQPVIGFGGGTFDGRYVYLAPYYANGIPTHLVPRYDTQAPFDQAGSWSTFDTTALTPNGVVCIGSLFDGRYVYFVPFLSDELERYDTTASFKDPASWKSFHMKTVHPKGERFRGGVFDGRYVYLVPSELSVVMRFDAHTPSSMPPSYHGSFL